LTNPHPFSVPLLSPFVAIHSILQKPPSISSFFSCRKGTYYMQRLQGTYCLTAGRDGQGIKTSELLVGGSRKLGLLLGRRPNPRARIKDKRQACRHESQGTNQNLMGGRSVGQSELSKGRRTVQMISSGSAGDGGFEGVVDRWPGAAKGRAGCTSTRSTVGVPRPPCPGPAHIIFKRLSGTT